MAKHTDFIYTKKQHFDRKFLASLCIFPLIVILFYMCFSSVSESTSKRQKEHLENAINRNIVHYYATEGHYPDNLSVLTERYGLTYDRNHFFVDYRVQGSNIYPDVTIIEKED